VVIVKKRRINNINHACCCDSRTNRGKWGGQDRALTMSPTLLRICKMNGEKSQGKGLGGDVILIRKYPNRRFYNTQTSSHVTLQEICELVREGGDIKVEDSKTGTDITVAVLTQILLEIESPKLVFFPSSLLQHLIRLNSSFLGTFSENYFHQALASFQRAQNQWGGTGLSGWVPPFASGAEEWSKAWSKVFEASSKGNSPRERAQMGDDLENPRGESGHDPETVDQLRRELEHLKERLGRMEKPAK
jgi:polyhydroxyalkanoate synthesis repressor PhaR